MRSTKARQLKQGNNGKGHLKHEINRFWNITCQCCRAYVGKKCFGCSTDEFLQIAAIGKNKTVDT